MTGELFIGGLIGFVIGAGLGLAILAWVVGGMFK